MGQAIQRGDRRLYEPVTRLIVEIGDQAKSAAVALVGFFIKSLGLALDHRRDLEKSSGGRRATPFRGR